MGFGIKIKLKRMLTYIRTGMPEQHIHVEVKTTLPNEKLKDKRVVITGGGRGLGYYIAHRAIAEGASVLITGRNEETLKKAVSELGANSSYLVFDATNVDGITEFLIQAESKLKGKIDCLVSNAGISLHEGNFRNVTEDGWDKQMDTNLKGNYFLVKEYVQYLERQQKKKGTIVVITSERGKRPDDIPYGLTKVATSSFVQAMASKVIEEGIRINAVGPGVTASDMTGFNKDGNLYCDYQPQKRIFMPEEVAEVVTFLLSDVSACISGEVITCDQSRYVCHW